MLSFLWTAFVFNKLDLTSHLAGASTTKSFSPYTYTSPGLENLTVTIANAKDFSPTKKGALIINFKGDMKLIGVIPVAEIKKKLVGFPITQTESILKPYAAVLMAGSSGQVNPPWAKVPSDPNKISVVVQGQ